MHGYNPETVEARDFEGETPYWYDPNASVDTIIINFADKEQIKCSSRALQRVIDKNYRKLSPEQRQQLLLEAAKAQGDVDMNLDMNAVRRSISEREKRQRAQEKNGDDSLDTKKNTNGEIPLPKVQAVLGFSGGVEVTAFYHEIIINLPFVILVFDTRLTGYPKVLPKTDAEFTLDTQELEKPIEVQSLGLRFTHEHYEYCVLVLKFQPEIPEDEEQFLKEVTKLEQLEKQVDDEN